MKVRHFKSDGNHVCQTMISDIIKTFLRCIPPVVLLLFTYKGSCFYLRDMVHGLRVQLYKYAVLRVGIITRLIVRHI